MPLNIGSSTYISGISLPALRSSIPISNVRTTRPDRGHRLYTKLVILGISHSGDTNRSNHQYTSQRRVFSTEAIGAEYGEGFESFRQDGRLKIDVDFLNERLHEGFLQRIRCAMKPDEAYGLIFSWDNVVVDVRNLNARVLEQLKEEEEEEEGKELPGTLKPMLDRSMNDLLCEVFGVEEASEEWKRLRKRAMELLCDGVSEFRRDGLVGWLEAVSRAGVPCAVVSKLSRKTTTEALERMGIGGYFRSVVAEEDGMESLAHGFLSAAVKLDRKPSKCVVFEDDPRGIAAAHNCTMMAVALVGRRPAYDLRQADLALSRFADLSVMNLRRLFAHQGLSFMDPQKQDDNRRLAFCPPLPYHLSC